MITQLSQLNLSKKKQPALVLLQITLVFLQDEVFNLWPVIVGSCAGGLILLAFLTVLLWKVGITDAHTATQIFQIDIF